MSDIDPNTGLPELPKRQYFKIVKWNLHYDLEVKLIERVWGFIPVVRGSGLAMSNHQSIVAAARDAMRIRNHEAYLRANRAARQAEMNKFVGKYPPKRLGK